MRNALFSTILFCFALSPLAAQQSEQGLYPGVTYDSDMLGNVNLRTGDLAVKRQLLSLPQWKGFNVGDLYLQYNNVAWVWVPYYDASDNLIGSQWMPTDDSQPSVMITQTGAGPIWTAVPLPDDVGNIYVWKWVVTTQDGSTHDMIPSGTVFRSIDGTNLLLNSTATQLTDSNATVYAITVPGGRLIPGASSTSSAYNSSFSWPMNITNIHSQMFSPTSSPGSDTMGRVYSGVYGNDASTDYSGCTGPRPTIGADVLFVTTNSGDVAHAVAKLCYTRVVVQTQFGGCHDGQDDCEYGDTWTNMVQSIVFSADGTTWSPGNAWTFLYGRTDVTAANYVNYGVLTGIQSPQGGTISYVWQAGGWLSNVSVQSKFVNAGDGTSNQPSTSYAYGTYSTTVTNPDLTSVKHTFDEVSSVETGGVYYDAVGNIVKTVSSNVSIVTDVYNTNGAFPPFATAYPTSVTTTWPGGRTCNVQTPYTWGFNYSIQLPETGNPNPPIHTGFVPYGEPASQSTYDCGNGAAGSLLASTQTSWLEQQNSTYFSENLFGLAYQQTSSDGSGNLVAQTTYGYDEYGESGNPGDQTTASSLISPSGAASITSHTYYSNTGNPTKTVDYSGNSTITGYDPTGLVATSTTLPAVPSGVTLSASSTVDQYSYLPTSQTDVAGATSTQNYDGLFRPTTGTLANGAATAITYVAPTSTSLPMTVASQTIDTSGTTTSSQTVTDGFGRTLQSNQQTNNGTTAGWYQQDTCYDIMGRVSFKSYQYVTWSATPVAHSCALNGDTFQYDPLGRLIKTTHQDGTYSSVSYTGMATQTTDEMGVSKIAQVDGLGRVITVCEISSNSSMPGSGSPTSCGTDIAGTGFVTTYSYSLAAGTTTVTQGGQVRAFQSDALGRTVSISEPESGTTRYSYSYNATGLQTVRTKPRANQTNSMVYTTATAQADSIGRTMTVTYANSDGAGYVTPPKVFAYDAPGGNSGVVTYSNGRLLLATTGATTTTIGGYDAVGDVLSTRQCLPDWCGQPSYDVIQSYQYDLRGLMTKMQYMTQASTGSAIAVNTGYNLSGDLAYVSGGQNNVSTLMDSSGVPILFQTTQIGAFGLTAGKFGNNLGVGASYDTMGRSQSGWVCSSGVTTSGCPGASKVYSFSSLGWMGGYLNASTDSALSQTSTYSYDEFGRLKTMNIGGGASVYTYGYDRWGNRLSQTLSNGGSGPQPSLSVNTANNQVAGDTYDAAGNVMSDGLHSYTYDAEGNMVGVDCTALYVYDASNHRVKTVNTAGTVERYAFNVNGQRASTWDNTGNLLTANYYAGGTSIAYYSSTDGHIHFEHQDWEGTERVRTTYTGAVEGSYVSLPFGDGSSSTGTDNDPYHFAKLDFDSDSGTSHASARQYSSVQGRWMSPDPYRGSYDFSNPQSMNRYAYVLNNPLSMTDPSGLDGRGCDEAPSLGDSNNCYDEGAGEQQQDQTQTRQQVTDSTTVTTTLPDNPDLDNLFSTAILPTFRLVTRYRFVSPQRMPPKSPWDSPKRSPDSYRDDIITILKGTNGCSYWMNLGTGANALKVISNVDIKTQPLGRGENEAITGPNPTDPIILNTNGPFFENRYAPRVGPYAQGSHNARMVILLHELAHKVLPPGFIDKDGVGLFDAKNGAGNSEKNTQTVINNCSSSF